MRENFSKEPKTFCVNTRSCSIRFVYLLISYSIRFEIWRNCSSKNSLSKAIILFELFLTDIHDIWRNFCISYPFMRWIYVLHLSLILTLNHNINISGTFFQKGRLQTYPALSRINCQDLNQERESRDLNTDSAEINDAYIWLYINLISLLS